jgi:general secretion pathway protein G
LGHGLGGARQVLLTLMGSQGRNSLARHHPGGRQKGFSLLELVVVVCIVAVLATLATERLMETRIQAERVAMDTLLNGMRSALGIKVAETMAKDRAASLAELVGSNPVDQLAEPPEAYRGSFYGIDPILIEGGTWYFDKRDGMLVYRVRFDDYFETGLSGPARARFRVSLAFDDLNKNQKFDPESERPTGLRLQPVEPYQWLDRPR